MAQCRPKAANRRPKRPPRDPKRAPRVLPGEPQAAKIVDFYLFLRGFWAFQFFFTFSSFQRSTTARKTLQTARRQPKRPPKSARTRPTKASTLFKGRPRRTIGQTQDAPRCPRKFLEASKSPPRRPDSFTRAQERPRTANRRPKGPPRDDKGAPTGLPGEPEAAKTVNFH